MGRGSSVKEAPKPFDSAVPLKEGGVLAQLLADRADKLADGACPLAWMLQTLEAYGVSLTLAEGVTHFDDNQVDMWEVIADEDAPTKFQGVTEENYEKRMGWVYPKEEDWVSFNERAEKCARVGSPDKRSHRSATQPKADITKFRINDTYVLRQEVAKPGSREEEEERGVLHSLKAVIINMEMDITRDMKKMKLGEDATPVHLIQIFGLFGSEGGVAAEMLFEVDEDNSYHNWKTKKTLAPFPAENPTSYYTWLRERAEKDANLNPLTVITNSIRANRNPPFAEYFAAPVTEVDEDGNQEKERVNLINDCLNFLECESYKEWEDLKPLFREERSTTILQRCFDGFIAMVNSANNDDEYTKILRPKDFFHKYTFAKKHDLISFKDATVSHSLLSDDDEEGSGDDPAPKKPAPKEEFCPGLQTFPTTFDGARIKLDNAWFEMMEKAPPHAKEKAAEALIRKLVALKAKSASHEYPLTIAGHPDNKMKMVPSWVTLVLNFCRKNALKGIQGMVNKEAKEIEEAYENYIQKKANEAKANKKGAPAKQPDKPLKDGKPKDGMPKSKLTKAAVALAAAGSSRVPKDPAPNKRRRQESDDEVDAAEEGNDDEEEDDEEEAELSMSDSTMNAKLLAIANALSKKLANKTFTMVKAKVQGMKSVEVRNFVEQAGEAIATQVTNALKDLLPDMVKPINVVHQTAAPEFTPTELELKTKISDLEAELGTAKGKISSTMDALNQRENELKKAELELGHSLDRYQFLVERLLDISQSVGKTEWKRHYNMISRRAKKVRQNAKLSENWTGLKNEKLEEELMKDLEWVDYDDDE